VKYRKAFYNHYGPRRYRIAFRSVFFGHCGLHGQRSSLSLSVWDRNAEADPGPGGLSGTDLHNRKQHLREIWKNNFSLSQYHAYTDWSGVDDEG
jgi:hypothetical protein